MYKMNYHDLRGVIDYHIELLQDLKLKLDIDRLCEETGLEEPEKEEIEMVFNIIKEAEKLHKLHEKMKRRKAKEKQ